MDSAKSVLRSIILCTDQIRSAVSLYSAARGVRHVRQHSLIRLEIDFQTIIQVSRATLEAFDNPLLCTHYTLDDRLLDWLSSDEPDTCLDVLKRMEKLLGIGPEAQVPLHRLEDGPPTTRHESEEDDIDAAIALFQANRTYFHFLFERNIWNHDTGVKEKTLFARAEGMCTQGEERQLRSSQPIIATIDNGRTEVFSQKREKMVKYLDALHCSEKHRQVSLMRQSDTCTWLRETDSYKSWRTGNDPFLWLQGKAGSGKTVLVSSVINDLSAKNDGEVLVYFYCDFRTTRSTSAVEVMRSILAQLMGHLLEAEPDAEQVIDELLKDHNSRPDPFYNPNGLAGYVSKVAKVFAQKPLVVVDALDECKEVESLLDGLTAIFADVRVFATSRPLQNIVDILSPFPCVLMDRMTTELSADIRLHITRELDSRCRLRAFDEELKEEIRVELCARADGMFRWVQCQIDTLEGCTSRSEIRSVLKSLPEGLEETYRRILIAIDRRASDASLVRRALKWLVTALRPFRMPELLEGITIDPDYRMLVSDFKLMNGDDLLKACRSLVTYDHETGVITLSHMSVKEYLVGELVATKLSAYHINLEDAHEYLARRCMAYLAILLEDSEEPGNASSSSPQQPGLTSYSSHPLLKYVLSDGFGHLGRLGPGKVNILNDIQSLQVLIRRYAWRWDQVCKLVPSGRTEVPWPTSKHDFLLYILIVFGSDPLFETFVRRTSLVPQEGANSLVYAAHFDKPWHAKVLISHGADVNRPGLVVDSHLNTGDDLDVTHKEVALEVAVDRWHLKVIDLLLAEGSSVPETLLMRVLRHRPHDFPLSVIKRLLETPAFFKWEAAPWDNQRLLKAIIDNAEDYEQVGSGEELQLVVKRLVLVGCAEALLLAAIENGCIPVIKILLSADVSSDLGESSAWRPDSITSAISINGDGPLHMTMKVPDERRCLIITKLLVDAGCNPFDLDADDKPPIHTAVARGFISVVEYLLSRGVPLPSKILFTALQVTHLKRVQMIRFLINNGAKTRVLSPNGDTLLNVVMKSMDRPDFQEIIRMLLDDNRFDLSACNSCGETPIYIATKEGYIGNYLLLFARSSDILPLLDPSSQATAFRSLLGAGVDRSYFPPEEENRQLHSLREFLDDEDKHLALAIKLLADNGDLRPGIMNRIFDSAVRRGFYRVVDYLLSQNIPLPHDILFVALKHRPLMIPFLVEKGAQLHAKDNNSSTLLHVSRRTLEESQFRRVMQVIVPAGYLLSTLDDTDTDIVDYLISHDMPLPHNILFFALRKWHKDFQKMMSTLSLLVSKGANVHIQEPHGDTILHHAIRRQWRFSETESLQVTKLFVEAGCSISVLANAIGELPVHTAVTETCPSLVEYLLSLDAPPPPDILLTWTRKARASAASGDRTWLDLRSILSLLISKRAEVNAQTNNGDTSIHLSIRDLEPGDQESPSYSETEAFKVIKLLVEAGCSISIPNALGELPVHIAVTVVSPILVEYLVSLDTPLPPDILLTWTRKALASAVNTQSDSEDRPPIHLDIRNLDPKEFSLCSGIKALEVTKLLVETGCNISIPNAVGELLVHIAVTIASPTHVKYLLSLNAPLPPDILLTWTKEARVSTSNYERRWSCLQSILSLLICKGANVNAQASDGDTPIHLAISYSNRPWSRSENEALEVTKILVQAGCSTSIPNDLGELPVQTAVAQVFPTVVEYLLSVNSPFPRALNISILIMNMDTRGILRALDGEFLRTIALLIQNGANVHARTTNGDSILHVVLAQSFLDHLHVVKFLVEKGCDPHAKNDRGYTPLDIAMAQERFKAAKFLRTLGHLVLPDPDFD